MNVRRTSLDRLMTFSVQLLIAAMACSLGLNDWVKALMFRGRRSL